MYLLYRYKSPAVHSELSLQACTDEEFDPTVAIDVPDKQYMKTVRAEEQ